LICTKLKAQTTTFNQGKKTGNMEEYTQCSYSLHKAIKQAKRQYRDKVESSLTAQTRDACGSVYRQPRIIKGKKAKVLLPDRLNTFFARFEDNTVPLTGNAIKDCRLSFSVANTRKTFKRVNPRKAASPEGIHSRILRACADQLADVFTDIFNLTLSQSVVPTCFKMATIVPIPMKAKVI
jgi:hypothetical protein